MTLREAAMEVLRQSHEPLRCTEIATEIRRRKLHPLRTQYPTSVVNKAIRRHCIGVSTDGERPDKVFRVLPNRRYMLSAARSETE